MLTCTRQNSHLQHGDGVVLESQAVGRAAVELLPDRDARVDERARTVELSMIFKWYARDFAAAGAAPLLPWLARYLPPAPAAALGRLLGDGGPPPKIQYAPYDWESNDGTS